MARILVFGDSIAYGNEDKNGGWVERLKNFFIEKSFSDPNFYYSVYNLGVSGDTTEELLKRFEFETKHRLWLKDEIIIIFDIGINDSQFINKEKRLKVPPQKFEENLQNLIITARKFSSKIIFVGLNPVDDLKVDPLPWFPEVSYKNEYSKKFNEIIKLVCEKNNVYFINILNEFFDMDYKRLLEDGAHPNSKGHEKIFETVKDFLIRKKIVA
jgi:lysophospholipase L1-like esterase